MRLYTTCIMTTLELCKTITLCNAASFELYMIACLHWLDVIKMKFEASNCLVYVMKCCFAKMVCGRHSKCIPFVVIESAGALC